MNLENQVLSLVQDFFVIAVCCLFHDFSTNFVKFVFFVMHGH